MASSNGGLVKQYQGLSSKDLHRATFYTLCGLAEHKQYVKSKILDEPSGFHFNQPAFFRVYLYYHNPKLRRVTWFNVNVECNKA